MAQSGLAPINSELLAIIHDALNDQGGLQPFAREIMLIECHVAGTGYADVEAAAPELKEGSILCLKRESKNPHDEKAIMIFDEKGRRLGYVPRVKNEALANLMDAGKLLFGKLDEKSWEGQWLRLQIRVFLRD